MIQVRQGAIANEIGEMQEWQGYLFEDAADASKILDGQGNPSPRDLARPWKKLGADRQAELGEGLLDIAYFGHITDDHARFARLHSESRFTVMQSVRAFHSALPFTETERAWMADQIIPARDEAIPLGGWASVGSSAIHWVMEQRGEIANLGRRQTVNGAELVSREWDWIRGGGDYKGNSTYDEAQTALRGFVRLFDNKSPLTDHADPHGGQPG